MGHEDFAGEFVGLPGLYQIVVAAGLGGDGNQQVGHVVVRAEGVDEGYIIADGFLGGGHDAVAGADAEAADADAVGVYEILAGEVLEGGDKVVDVLRDHAAIGHDGGPVEHGGHVGAGEGFAETDDAGVVGAGGGDAEEENDSGEGTIAGGAVEVAYAVACGDGEGDAFSGWGPG